MNKSIEFPTLTRSHKQLLSTECSIIETKPWSLHHPVFLLEPSWLRLKKLTIKELLRTFPTDNSCEAPELLLYNQLLNAGQDPLIALQECWHEYGMDEFYRALRNYWFWKDQGNGGWTFRSYLNFLDQYKGNISNGCFSIPIIALSRDLSLEDHRIEWFYKS